MSASPLPKLRPLGIGELLDQAIRIYRRNFLIFVGIVALVQIPLTLLQWILTLSTFDSAFERFNNFGSGSMPTTPLDFLGGNIGSTIALFVLGIASFVLVQGLATAALTRATADYYLGQKVGLMEAYRKIGNSWLPLVGALLIAMLLSILLGFWLLIPCIGWFTGLGMLYFFSSIVIPLMAPAIVLEGQSAGRAWKRAWNLSRRRFWQVIGFTLILMILGQFVIAGPTALVSLLFQFVIGSPFEAANPMAAYALQTTVQTAVTILFSIIYLPLQLTAITLLYFDLRVRTEGFDMALLAENMAGKNADVTAVTAQTPELESFSITSTELGYFALLSIGAVALYFVLISIIGLIGVAIMSGSGGF